MATFAQLIQFGPYFSGGNLTTLKVYHYTAGTTTLKNVFTDRGKNTAAAQPVVSDANGIASFYADGLYKFRVDASTDGVVYSTLYTYDNWAVGDQSSTLSGEGAALASASTLTLGTDGDYFHVTGTVPTSVIVGTQAQVTLVADAAWPLVHSGNLLLQDSTNYTANVGDVFVFQNDGSDVWREASRWHASSRNGYLHDGPAYLENLTITASVAASALTLAIKTKAGTDPSITDPVRIAFRNATLGTGDYTVLTLSAALSFTVSSGSTLGTASAVAHRLYVGIANDGGTLRLFLYNPLISATLDLAGIQDDLLYSSTAEGGAGAADTAQVLYSGTAFTTKAVRLLGYVESTQATAGTWATTPSKIHLLKPWDKRTGDVVKVFLTQTGAVATGTTLLPWDDTIPQNTEGDQYMSLSVTYTSAINRAVIEHAGFYNTNSGQQFAAALFQDSTANALATMGTTIHSATFTGEVTLRHEMAAGTVSATTFKIRAGGNGAGTTTFNGTGGGRLYGGTLASHLKVTEIMV